MNFEQIRTVITKLLPFLGGLAVMFGYMKPAVVNSIVANLDIILGAAVTIATAGYDIWRNTRANQLTVVAVGMPDVLLAVPTKAEADKLPSNVVPVSSLSK